MEEAAPKASAPRRLKADPDQVAATLLEIHQHFADLGRALAERDRELRRTGGFDDAQAEAEPRKECKR